ncbi:delta-like protein 1 isoform X2 [Daktulosphaira vitifoliae]|uniref:delta-like protein 1 isoform X2 n=1 Tax=Daktulosphaira vitifoliae TaxID=58002 RepID=UPI0021AB0261|nr:delta-like protein 1 isoform X2 [Daktulosphaira vitifoliae]
MANRKTLAILFTLCTFGISSILAVSKNIPKWKKQACEAPATQNESSHYTCDDNGDMKCLPGWIGDLCDVPICKKGCDPIQGFCKRPNECRCKLGFYGDTCNTCIPLPGCQHGYCNNSFECKCEEGWDGIFCSEPVCHENCHPSKGYCNWPGECRCKVGWWGKNCTQCYPYPGCVHGTCNRPWECNCKPGWGGILCDQELKYCEKNNVVCQNNGTCVSLPEEDGNYRCICTDEFMGRNCEVDKKKVEIIGLMPPKPSLSLMTKATTLSPVSTTEELIEGEDEYEEESSSTNINSTITSTTNENEAFNETI